MVSRRFAAVGLVIAIGLSGAAAIPGVAAAQGGGTDFSKLKPVKAPSPCTNDPGVSSSEIKVGAILPESGPSGASFADSENGMRARFDLANSRGELGKRRLSIDVADDAGDPGRNVTAAQRLVEQDNVLGIMENSLVADASAKYLNAKGIPVVGWMLGLVSFGKYPNMFGWRNSYPNSPNRTIYTDLNYAFIKAKGATKVALLADNNAPSADFINQVSNVVKLVGNRPVKVVFRTTSVTIDQRDFSAEAQKIKDSGADAVVTGMDFLQNTALSSALTQVGVKPKVILFPGGYDSRVLTLPGIEGAYFGLEVIPFEQNPPAFATYKAQMQKEGKGFEGEIPYIGWLIADTFIEGLKAAGASCPTRKGFITNLRLEKNWTGHGAFDPVDFVKVFGRPFNYCQYYVQVVNAAFVPQFNDKAFCAAREIHGTKIIKLTPSRIRNA